jgi:hypothetical protein
MPRQVTPHLAGPSRGKPRRVLSGPTEPGLVEAERAISISHSLDQAAPCLVLPNHALPRLA